MTSTFRAAAIAIGCASLGACATITRGPNTDWTVATSPPGAKVQTSNGLGCDSTPCALQLSRKASFTATISKPGYKPVKVVVAPHLSTGGKVAFAGNVLIGGLIGAGVDVASGAINDLAPNDLQLALERDEASLAFDTRPPPLPTSAIDQGRLYSSEADQTMARIEPEQQGSVIAPRVTYIKVLPDNTVEEKRDVGY